jgi:hypothetical protein
MLVPVKNSKPSSVNETILPPIDGSMVMRTGPDVTAPGAFFIVTSVPPCDCAAATLSGRTRRRKPAAAVIEGFMHVSFVGRCKGQDGPFPRDRVREQRSGVGFPHKGRGYSPESQTAGGENVEENVEESVECRIDEG